MNIGLYIIQLKFSVSGLACSLYATFNARLSFPETKRTEWNVCVLASCILTKQWKKKGKTKEHHTKLSFHCNHHGNLHIGWVIDYFAIALLVGFICLQGVRNGGQACLFTNIQNISCTHIRKRRTVIMLASNLPLNLNHNLSNSPPWVVLMLLNIKSSICSAVSNPMTSLSGMLLSSRIWYEEAISDLCERMNIEQRMDGLPVWL